MGNRFIHPQIHAASIAGEAVPSLPKEDLLDVSEIPMSFI
jgi:hypothetical protein